MEPLVLVDRVEAPLKYIFTLNESIFDVFVTKYDIGNYCIGFFFSSRNHHQVHSPFFYSAVFDHQCFLCGLKKQMKTLIKFQGHSNYRTYIVSSDKLHNTLFLHILSFLWEFILKNDGIMSGCMKLHTEKIPLPADKSFLRICCLAFFKLETSTPVSIKNTFFQYQKKEELLTFFKNGFWSGQWGL